MQNIRRMNAMTYGGTETNIILKACLSILASKINMPSIFKWQALINRHLTVASYLLRQSLFPSTKIPLKIASPMELILGYPDDLRIIPFALNPQ